MLFQDTEGQVRVSGPATIVFCIESKRLPTKVPKDATMTTLQFLLIDGYV